MHAAGMDTSLPATGRQGSIRQRGLPISFLRSDDPYWATIPETGARLRASGGADQAEARGRAAARGDLSHAADRAGFVRASRSTLDVDPTTLLNM